MRIYQELLLNGDSPNPYSIYIPIKNDECVEYDEYFFVYIYASSDCVEFDNYNSSITILDDDGNFIYYNINNRLKKVFSCSKHMFAILIHLFYLLTSAVRFCALLTFIFVVYCSTRDIIGEC